MDKASNIDHLLNGMQFVESSTSFSNVDGDGFLRDEESHSKLSRSKAKVFPALARHANETLRAYGGVWDQTDENSAKAWCDMLLKMIRSSGDLSKQTCGAKMMTAAIQSFAASRNGLLETLYARCQDGIVWLLKHCRALTLKRVSGVLDLECSVFECCESLFCALAASSTGSVEVELSRKVTSLLGDVIPHFTSRLGLGISGVAGTRAAITLFRALIMALLHFETGMRPYLGPLRGALLRAGLFENSSVAVQRVAARSWSLICLSRSKVASRNKDNSINNSASNMDVNGLSTVPAKKWEVECMRVIQSLQELVGQICPSAAQANKNTQRADGDDDSNDSVLLARVVLTDTWPINEVLLANRLRILANVLSSMLSTGPSGASGGRGAGYDAREAMVMIPVLAIVDVLERLIICALNSQVSNSHTSTVGAKTLRALIPRLYAAFASIFSAMVDAVGTPLLRYTSRIGRTILQAVRYVSYTALQDAINLGHGCPCPDAMNCMLTCATRLACRHGAVLKQSFVEPLVILCVREVRIRMLSQPSDSLLLGRIATDGGGRNGKRSGKGKKRARNGGPVSIGSISTSVVASNLPHDSTRQAEDSLPVSIASSESHRRLSQSCMACINAMILGGGGTSIGSPVRNDVHKMLFALVGDGDQLDPRAANLRLGMGGHADHSGVSLRLSIYELLETCAVIPCSSTTSSILGVALNAFQSAIFDADHRIVSICRRGMAACRCLVYPQIAPLKTFEPKITPMAKRYKTSWPVSAADGLAPPGNAAKMTYDQEYDNAPLNQTPASVTTKEASIVTDKVEVPADETGSEDGNHRDSSTIDGELLMSGKGEISEPSPSTHGEKEASEEAGTAKSMEPVDSKKVSMEGLNAESTSNSLRSREDDADVDLTPAGNDNVTPAAVAEDADDDGSDDDFPEIVA